MAKRIYAVANQKGGVGKTTTAVNLATAMAIGGYRVLLVDLDPQANATSHIGLDKQQSANIYRVLVDEIPAEAACLPTDIDGVWIVPSHPDLYGAYLELPQLEDWQYRLKAVLSPLTLRFDYIWIDTPPSLGILTINALVAAEALIVPVQSEYFALEGLTTLLQAMERVRANYNPDLHLHAVILTMYDERTNLSRQVRDEITQFFDQSVLKSVIPRNVRLAEAPSFGQPIFLYDIRSRGAEAYLELARELLKYGTPSVGSRSERSYAGGQ